MKRTLSLLLVVAALFFLSSCAEKGPILLEGVTYEAPEGIKTETTNIVVGISPFKDERGKTPSVLGKRTIASDVENDLVVQSTVSDLVTTAFKDALKARGITVRDLPAQGRAGGAKIVIGGEIKTLWVDALSKPLDVKVTATVQLRVSAADGSNGAVFRTVVLNSKVERSDIAFSFDTVSGALSEALSGAIDQLMKDDEFKKRLQ